MNSILSLANRDSFPEGKALIIGGSGGIGESVCENFAANQVPVIFTYHNNLEAAQKLREKINSYGVSAEYEQLSLTDRDKVENFFSSLDQSEEKIHSIVNATGADIRMRWINELTYDEWQEVMHNDADGFFNLLMNQN